MAPLVGEWRELKNISWYRMQPIHSCPKRRRHAKRADEHNHLQAQDISYHCDIQPPEQFSNLFWESACQRKADLYEEVMLVCDGAVWIWKLIEKHFTHTVQIVESSCAWLLVNDYFPKKNLSGTCQ